MDEATIYALASAPGRAGVAVLRVSGTAAGSALKALAGALPEPRRARLAAFRDPATGEPVDTGLALWFPAPHSFTGEDVAELQVHGGPAVIGRLYEVLGAMAGLRLAEPGEFTRRAFEHGRLDLTEAEAIADLVAAETDGQRRQALAQLGGALGELYGGWADRLTRALAHLEADIDFAEDEDLGAGVAAAVRPELEGLRAEIAAHLDDDHRGERLREGLAIAILGAPNVGKSSLLNRIARREAAIVSAQAGTTRDVVEVHLDLGGWPAILADTAGLRESAEEIEAEGMRRALARAEAADLKLVVFDATRPPDAASLALLDARAVAVANQCDRPEADPAIVEGAFAVSAVTGEGMDALLAKLTSEVEARLHARGSPALTRARHREALTVAVQALDRALAAGLPELAAEDARLALRALGRITGRVDVEDLLDVIFRDFCIGK
jgi:tRNA modification GTPase